MTDKQQDKEDAKDRKDQPVPQPTENITIADISLSSAYLRSDTLACVALELLNKPEVKEYLQIIKKEKINGGNYLG